MKYVNIHVRVTPEEHKRIKKAAEIEGRSLNMFSRRTIVEVADCVIQADADTISTPEKKSKKT